MPNRSFKPKLLNFAPGSRGFQKDSFWIKCWTTSLNIRCFSIERLLVRPTRKSPPAMVLLVINYAFKSDKIYQKIHLPLKRYTITRCKKYNWLEIMSKNCAKRDQEFKLVYMHHEFSRNYCWPNKVSEWMNSWTSKPIVIGW